MLLSRVILKSDPCKSFITQRTLHTTALLLSKPLPPRLKINENEITENFIKGGGSGGQKINKTSSLVQLIHHPTGMHVRCQATRSRAQNRTTARRFLAERIEELQVGEKSRTAIKAERDKKKKASSVKKKRRKYRKLAEDEAAAGTPEDDDAEPDALENGQHGADKKNDGKVAS